MIKFRKLNKSEWFHAKVSGPKIYSIAATVNGKLAGFLTYKKYKSCINIIEVQVFGEFVKYGVLQALIEQAAEKMGELGKLRLEYVVPERNMEMLKFLQENGFIATQVLRNFYENSDEDGFRMVFSVENDEKVPINS